MFSNKSTDRNFRSPQASICSNCGSHVTPGDLFCQSCGSKIVAPMVTPPLAPSSRLDSFRGYIQIIGVIEIVFGVFALIIGVLIAFLVPLVFYLLRSEIEFDTPMMSRMFPFISVLLFGVAVLFFVYAIVSIVSGKKLLNYENSGRLGTMFIAALNLLNFPFGTLFGVAALYVLSRPEVEQLYTK